MESNIFYRYREKFTFKIPLVIFISLIMLKEKSLADCGCKVLTNCYKQLISKEKLFTLCEDDFTVGTSTINIYLKLIQLYCSEVVNATINAHTFEKRNLYEVRIGRQLNPDTPVILIEAGQRAGDRSVSLALRLLHQLVACHENSHMVRSVTWVILPSVNPDGLEISRSNRPHWNKNANYIGNSYGTDISRNFDVSWSACHARTSGHAAEHPGLHAFSERESVYIRDVMRKYYAQTRLYVSIRKDGHALLYPYAYSDKTNRRTEQMQTLAAVVASKVNEKAKYIHKFVNRSIYRQNGKKYCGHSVDYSLESWVPFAYEMRVFLETDFMVGNVINLPDDYEYILMDAYIDGIEEMYKYIFG